ncbi:SRPBCC family protein [Pseudomonas silesiensis]|uniref:SRPBCC family protein n=1 Tax=Pseudomonas silesiensis TaxID=1853130 RepID=UPI0030D88A97
MDLIASSSLSEGGRLRHLNTTTGEIIVERLLTYDEDERNYSYALLEGPSPVIDYVGTMSAKDDKSGGTLATWSSTFIVQGAKEAEVVQGFQVLYLKRLERLKAVVESMD